MTHQLQLFAFPYSRKKNFWGITRQARSWNSSVPLQRAWVQFLVGEMRSHKLHSMAKKEKKENLLSRTHKGIYSRVWMHCSCCLITQSCLILCNHHGLQPTRLHCPWDFPGKNTGVSCHFLLQQLNPSLLHCRWILYLSATREAGERKKLVGRDTYFFYYYTERRVFIFTSRNLTWLLWWLTP